MKSGENDLEPLVYSEMRSSSAGGNSSQIQVSGGGYSASGEPVSRIDKFLNTYHELMQDEKFTACLYVAVGTMFGSFWSVDMEYLEDQGIIWVQLFLIAQYEMVLFSLVMHLVFVIYRLYLHQYFTQESNNNNNNGYNEMTDDNNNNISENIVIEEKKSIWQEYISIFPSISEENRNLWKIIIIRGIFLSFSYQFKILALMYCNAGDVMVLRSMVTSFGIALVGIIYFGEKLTWVIILAFVLSVIGAFLICQPSFIFGSADTISGWGLLFICLAGLSRITEKTYVKRSNTKEYKSKLDWVALIILSFVITAIFASIVFIVAFIGFTIYSNNNVHTAWTYIWYNNTRDIVAFWMFMYGVFLLIRACCSTYGYQRGDITRLGIIMNGDCVFAYLVQAVALGVVCNYLVYVGAIIVVASSIILIVEQGRIRKNKGTITKSNRNTSASSRSNRSKSNSSSTTTSNKNTSIAGDRSESAGGGADQSLANTNTAV